MVRKIENFVLISFLAALLLLVQSSTSSPIQNDILEELKEELKSLRLKVHHLEARNVWNEAKIIKLEEKVGAQLQTDRLSPAATSFIDTPVLRSTDNIEMNRIDGKDSSLDGKAKEIANSIKLNFDNFLGALNDLDDSTSNNVVNSLKGQRSSNTDNSYSTRAIAPSSCRDLSLIGHSLDGLYLVQNENTNKIETVLCNFGTSISQQFIGDVDVKTKSVHFFVQRTTTFSAANAVIPWELARLNEGGAINLASGIFTVPVNGIYHFDFSGLKDESAPLLHINLQVNGATVAAAGTNLNGQPTGSYEMYSLTASLRLKVGDEVNLFNLDGGILLEDSHK